jgi:hypothetical protein
MKATVTMSGIVTSSACILKASTNSGYEMSANRIERTVERTNPERRKNEDGLNLAIATLRNRRTRRCKGERFTTFRMPAQRCTRNVC